jgi:hypothetical protein
MIYRILAAAVVLIHASFVLFVVFGGFLVIRWRWVSWLHAPAVTWGALIELFGWPCPLTPLENLLRSHAGAATFSAGFIDHYVVRALYPPGLTRGVQVMIGVLVIVVNVVAYTKITRSPGPISTGARPNP